VDAPTDADDRAVAFGALLERHLDAAYRLAGVILGNAAEADDATHDAALAAWRKRDGLRVSARFEPWFTRIVVNVCRDRLRGRRRHRVVEVTSAHRVERDDGSVADGTADTST